MKFTLSRVQKILFGRMGIAIAIMVAACVLPFPDILCLCMFIISYLFAGYDVLWESVRNIGHGRIFDETFLMSIATLGAIAIGEFPEAVIVMVLYQFGEFFEDYAEERSRRSITDLMDIAPETALVLRNGKEETMSPASVAVGETIIIRPGMKVPIDGVVIAGTSSLDTSALTGEALPRVVDRGDDVISGCINREGLLQVKTTKTFKNSAVSRILELVGQASAKKAKSEKFIDKFVRWYTPAVVGVAILVAVLPPLLFGQPWIDWISRALIFLVVSCPCALVISIPLTVFCGIGAGSRQGILIKGGNYLEMLAKAETIVFDKTGTITKGEFAVTEYDDEALRLASIAGCESTHPLSISLQKFCCFGEKPSKITEISGRGIDAEIEGNRILSGSKTFLSENGIVVPADTSSGSSVYVACNECYVGSVHLKDMIKDEAKDALAELKNLGVEKMCMLTGDRKEIAEEICHELAIDEYYANLFPHEKVTILENLLKKKPEKSTLVYVGDGVNDAPVLARADVGIAMGGLGSDAAIESADVVLMNDNLSGIPKAIRLSRKCRRIIRQNIVFTLGIKIGVLAVAACGFLNMWAAVFADVGVAILAIINATRMLKW